jgi:thymidylate synthase (FAD)
MKLWTAPKLTVLAAPQYTMPTNWPIRWPDGNEATDAEALSEYAGRLCYLSQRNPAQKTTAEYTETILSHGHGSVLEHASVSILVEGVSRALTHELIRHRAGTAVSQVSQRFVDESDADFVIPPLILSNQVALDEWSTAMSSALVRYQTLVKTLMKDPGLADLPATLARKRAREAARGVLPNSTETKLVWTANLRALRHVITLRGDIHADLEIHRFANVLLDTVRPLAPSVFADFTTAPDGSIIPRYPKV